MMLISEIGSNHNNDWNRCKKLIRQAKESGFNAVKFQLFRAEKLTKDKEAQKKYKEAELDLKWLPKISALCKELKLKFGCSPFYLEAIHELSAFVDFFKISSFDILRTDLIQKCLEREKDVYFSLGLATDEDIKNLFDLVQTYGMAKCNYYFLHCVSNYPTVIEDACLKRISDIFLFLFSKKKTNLFVGYSDHTKDVDVIRESLNQYSQAVELHFDLQDEKGNESKYGHCWTPKDVDKLYTKMNKLNFILLSNFELTEEQLKMRADPITGLRG